MIQPPAILATPIESWLREVARSTGPHASAPLPKLPPGTALCGGRFVSGELLGEGGMGVVYEAYDTWLEMQVAVKFLLHTPDPRALKREFRALEGLYHPNWVELHELFEDAGRWFFTMERIHGDSFVRHCRPALLDVERLRRALRQLARAVSALHTAGKVHRDVKPSNALVEQGGRVVLLDFGVLVDQHESGSFARHLAGTPAYMAPEQHRGVVGPAADWFAVGVMLYEALAGRRPFEDARGFAAGRAPSAALVRPSYWDGSAPADLEELCLQLLHPDPERRPRGQPVLARLGLAAADGGGAVSPSRAAKPFAQAGSSTGARPFVGRHAELEMLAGAFSCARERGAAVVVEGPAGVGKSALVATFCSALPESARVLGSHCREDERIPYQGFDGLADALAALLDELDAHELEAVVGPDTTLLPRIFPVLELAVCRATKRASLPQPPELAPHAARRAAFGELGRILTRLAARSPLVLVFDDMQWADADSRRALTELSRATNGSRWLLLMTSRPGAELPELASPPQFVRLTALDDVTATALVRALLARRTTAGAGDAERIAREGRGMPLFLELLVQCSVGSERGDVVDLVELVRERVRLLERDARDVLALVCVAGRPIAHEQLTGAAGLTRGALARAVRRLNAHCLALTVHASGQSAIAPYHDRVREAVLGALGAERLRSIHRDLACALESARAGAHEREALARHWYGAGEPKRALDHAVEAAAHARDTLAFDRAVELYGFALSLAAPGDPLRPQLQRGHAEAFADAGRGQEAAAAYRVAAALAGEGERWILEQRAAEQLLRAGHIDAGLSAIDRVLRPLDVKRPATPWFALVQLLAERARELVDPVAGVLGPARGVLEARDLLERRADACRAVAIGLSQFDPLASSALSARYLRYARSMRDEERIALGLCLRAPQLATAGPPARRAQRALVRVRRVAARKPPGSLLEANEALARAGVSFLCGDLRLALQAGERALELLRVHPGTAWELATAQRFVLSSLWHLGRLRELEARTAVLLEDAEHRCDLYAANQLRTTTLPMVHLKNDQPDRAREELDAAARDLPLARSPLQRWQHRQHCALVALYAQQDARALELMLQKRGRAYSWLLNGISAARVSNAFVRATASLAVLAASRAAARGPARCLRIDLYRLEREQTAGHLCDLLHGQRAWLTGDRSAELRLEHALRSFRERDMKIYEAVSLWCLGRLRDSEPDRERAMQIMAGEGVVNPERLAGMLAPAFRRPAACG